MSDMATTLRDGLSGAYRVEREVGRGAMATVYLATDIKHERRVAIKVLDPQIANLVSTERFLKEIRIMATLQHPHILPLFDSGEIKGQLYYVMPFVEGESLRARLSREGRFSVHEAARITAEIASAIDFAHRHGVIHRDIKPENILLADGHALVADFGIARALLSDAAAAERLTATGLAVGTPGYMSPEQATGDGGADGRTDVYALGAVCHEMLAGEPPFRGPSATAFQMAPLAALSSRGRTPPA
jgi:serine/threonine-protein kinase